MKIGFGMTLAFTALMAVQAPAQDLSGGAFISSKTAAAIKKDYRKASKSCRQSYTVAVSSNGYWAVRCHGKASGKVLARMTLEKCEHTAGRKCGLIMLRGKPVTFREAGSGISYGKAFRAAKVPFVRDASRREIQRDYAGAAGFRALAINRNGAWGIATGMASAKEAKKAALADCQANTRLRRSCFIYAVGDNALFRKSTNIYR